MAPGKGIGRVVRCCCECGLGGASPVSAGAGAGFANLETFRTIQRRGFSSSGALERHAGRIKNTKIRKIDSRSLGAVPTFHPPSNPALDDLLTRFRNNTILPAHLTKKDRQVIYNHLHAEDLKRNPRVVELEGEEFTLQHIDKTKDVPSPTRDLIKAISLMNDRDDWVNLPILLEGLETAKVMPRVLIPRIIRKAALAGQQDLIVETARRVERTGLSLGSIDTMREAMWGMHWLGMVQAPKYLSHALRWAEQIDQMSRTRRHSYGVPRRGGQDVREKLETVAPLLELSAALALDKKQRKGENGDVEVVDRETVEQYAKRLVAAPQLDEEPLQPPSEFALETDYLRWMVPVQHGARLALEVLGQDSALSAILQKLEEDLGVKLKEERDRLVGLGFSNTLGHQSYAKLIEGKEEEETVEQTSKTEQEDKE